MSSLTDQLAESGFAIIPELLTESEVKVLKSALASAPGNRGGQRNLLDLPVVAALATDARIRALVEPVLGVQALPVRTLLFDKTPDANWKVAWHQDLTIAVREQRDVEGYGPWSTKAGVVHVQPPPTILEGMLAVRLHLDDCGVRNGPVRVLPGSHRAGKISGVEIPQWRDRVAEVVCIVPRGGVLLMRPLLLHASSSATSPAHRRVIHIEFASGGLAAGLAWHWASPVSRVLPNKRLHAAGGGIQGSR